MAGRRSEDKETYLAVARAMFRMDRASPDLPGAMADQAWGDVKVTYVKRARKLLDAFDREGITLLIPQQSLSEAE